MSTRHVLVCLPPDHGARSVDTRVRTALWKVRRHFTSYRIGEGRYTEYFPLSDTTRAADPRLVRSYNGGPVDRCAGGPVGLLDLAAMRAQQEVRAAELHDAWTQATAHMPPARPWSEFADGSVSDFAALIAFREQPQLKVLADLTGSPRRREEDAALVALDRTAFIARARRRAVPGNSLLEVDSTWSTDPAWLNDDDVQESGSTAYHDRVNAYLDGLSPDHLVVGVDCRR